VNRKLAAIIVAAAMLAGFVGTVFVVPLLQPARVRAESALDEAAERAARRLEVLSRLCENALYVDRLSLTPARASKDVSEAALQRLVATKPDLLEPARRAGRQFESLLRRSDEKLKALTGAEPAKPAEVSPPPSDAAKAQWLRKKLEKTANLPSEVLSRFDRAISQLSSQIASTSADGFTGRDHYRANWVLGCLQYHKAMFLNNMAVARRNAADRLRLQITLAYSRYADAAARAKAIKARFEPVAISETQVQTAQRSQPPQSQPAPAATPAQQGGILQRLKGLLRRTGTPQPAPGQAPAGQQQTGQGQAEQQTLKMQAAQDPIKVVDQYYQQISQQIAQTRRRISGLEEQIRQRQGRLQQLQSRLATLQERLSEIEMTGYDVTDPQSFQKYRKTYEDLAARIRAVETEIQAIQEGTLLNAKLDPESDDPLRGKYIDGKPFVGLRTLKQWLANEQQTLRLLEAALAELDDIRKQLQKQQEITRQNLRRAERKATEIAGQIKDAFEKLQRLVAEAEALEEKALDSCQQAIGSFKAASRAANNFRREAAQLLQTANPSPDKPNVRLDMLSQYDSPEAAAEHALCEAYCLKGQIHLQRLLDLAEHAKILAIAQACGIREIDPADIQHKMQQAYQQALVALDDPKGQDDALGHAERFSNLISRQKFAWLGPAMQGIVLNLASQVEQAVGNDRAAGARRTQAVQALQQAVQGNEDSELLQPYVTLLTQLSGGQG